MLVGMRASSVSLTRDSTPQVKRTPKIERRAATFHRWWTSRALRAPPCPLRPLPPVLGDPRRGGGSRRSLHRPLGRADSRERSASLLVWAPPWEARHAGCYGLP